MNARLSLNNRPEPSLAQQAHRLESFEIALREERIEALEEMITSDREGFEYEIVMLRDQLALMANEQKLSLERNAEGLKREQELREKVSQLLRECQQLKDTRDEFEKAGNQLADDKERLQGEIERLIIQDNANARVLAKTQEKLKAAEAEVKRLREMEPDRLKAQVKRLQKKRTEAVAGAQKMRTRNHQLAKQNRQLDIALDKAIAQANAVQELKPDRIFEPGRVGRWELFTCPKDGWYQLLDTENEVSQTVRVEGSELITPKIRPVPKAIAAEVLAFHQAFFGGAV
jgi:chromosome segregation ATPase